MKITLLILALLLAPALYAQTAQVIVLSPAEAKASADLYAQKAEIDAKISAFKRALEDKYIVPLCASGRCGSVWFNGFEFSTDFKAIVPVPALNLAVPYSPYMPCVGMACLTITPTYSTEGAKPFPTYGTQPGPTPVGKHL
jgi:hypothetical protein